MSNQSGNLKLKNITKVFGNGPEKVTAVDNFNLTINPGEFVTLLGPSGCGKTTTLRMIAGFETPTEGEITLDGKDLKSLTPDRRPMGMVFQSYALFPHMSVFDNVAYGLRVQHLGKSEIEKRVAEVLETMSLGHLAERAPNQLSGGQQQRVALARAMVVQPKVLLFDEPLSNLDAKLRAQMRVEIRKIQQRLGITSVFVTHDQDEAMSLSDRIVVMRNAVVEQSGTPDEIYRKPNSVFVADFIGRSNFFTVDKVESTSSGTAKVLVNGESMEVASHPKATNSANPVLLVRPESIQVKSANSSKSIGTVTNIVFYGNHVEYSISTSYGEITAIESDPIYDEIVQPGNGATLEFHPSRAWLLPNEGKIVHEE